MTEVEVGSAQQHGVSPMATEPAPAGAGQLLRQAREQQHMSVQALASSLKVPVYKLQALEEERWDNLTDSVFARALALSICRLLRIPSEPILAGMPKLEGAKLASNPEGINAPYKEKSLRSLMSSTTDSHSGHASKVAAGVLIAVALGAVLYFLPHWQGDDAPQEVAAPAVVGQGTEEPLFMPALQTGPEVAVPDVPAGEAVPVASTSTALPVAVPELVADTSGQPAVVVAPTAPLSTSAPATAGARVLRFTATGETWVQVRNAQQQVLMEKILKAGDVYESTVSQQPLQAVVGNVGATTLQIDGATFDLAASAKNNVARFEVK